MFDIEGKLVNVDVRESRYPIRQHSKSTLQGRTAEILRESFPIDTILEEFPIPGSRQTADFFLPRKKLVVEVDGRQHDEFVPFFHGDRNTSDKYAKQKSRDRLKDEWCEINGFRFVRIKIEDDLENLK